MVPDNKRSSRPTDGWEAATGCCRENRIVNRYRAVRYRRRRPGDVYGAMLTRTFQSVSRAVLHAREC